MKDGLVELVVGVATNYSFHAAVSAVKSVPDGLGLSLTPSCPGFVGQLRPETALLEETVLTTTCWHPLEASRLLFQAVTPKISPVPLIVQQLPTWPALNLDFLQGQYKKPVTPP